MHRLEERRERALRVQVRRRRDADRPRARGAKVREDVAEEVRAHHDVEPVRMRDEVRGENVDVELVDAHVGIPRGHRLDALVPVRHRDRDPVRLRGGGQVLLRARLREVEREAQDPVDTLAGEARLLEDDLALGVRVHPAADARVLALRVLAHHEEVDVARLAIGERAPDAGHETARPEVDVLVELAAELDQHAPERDVVRYGRGPAHRAEEQRVVAADLVLPVLRHHRAVLGVVVAAPVEVIELEVDVELAGRRIEHAQPFGDDLLADAVARDDRDPVCGH